jgi:hypothetical protein
MPLVVAAVGVVAVAVGAGVAARSALRVRLIDSVREDARDHRDFQVRAVAAVNALGTASALVIRTRLAFLRAQRNKAHAHLIDTGVTTPITLEAAHFSPTEDARVVVATEEWRRILAEGHAFASEATSSALEAFDQKRAELVDAVNVATDRSDISDAIRGLEAADALCEDLRSHFGKQIYRHLQVEKVSGSARMFQLAHMRTLRAFAKQVTAMHHADIDAAQELISRSEREHKKTRA